MLIPRTKKTKVGTDLVKVEVFFPRRIMTKLVAHVHIGDNCWGLRFTNEHHIRFARRPVTLFDIAQKNFKYVGISTPYIVYTR